MKGFLCTAVSVGALLGSLAYADETANQYKSSEARGALLEEVEVVGIRRSIEAAMDLKREANTVVDALSAEDLGQFSDENLAEALQRIPGVQIERDASGEGQSISIRGLGPQFSRTTVNGRSGLSAGVDGAGAARAFGFDTLATEMVKDVLVYKAPTAALDEGGLGGVVEVRTARPLDLKDTYKGSFSVKNTFDELADKNDQGYTLFGGAKFLDDKFGVLFSGVFDERTSRNDTFDQTGYRTATIDGVTGERPQALRQVLLEEQRNRENLALTVQWQPSDSWNLTFDTLWAELDREAVRSDLALGTSGINSPQADVVGLNASGVFDYLETRTVPNTDRFVTSGVGELSSTSDTLVSGFNVEWNNGPWSVSGDVAYSEVDSQTDFSRFGLSAPGAVIYDNRSGGDTPSWSHSSDLSDPSIWNPWIYQQNQQLFDAQELAFKLDTKVEIDWKHVASVQFGAKAATTEGSTVFYNTQADTSVRSAGTALSDVYTNPLSVGDFGQHSNAQYPQNWATPDITALLADFPAARLDENGQPPQDFDGTFVVEEDVSSIYAMANLDGELFGFPYTGNAGVRYATTDWKSHGFVAEAPVSAKGDYSDVLPSLNLAVNVREDMVVRFAGAKVLTRPDYNDLTPGFRIKSVGGDGTPPTANAGNTNLDPYRATQYDLTYEWYLDDATAFYVGAFYKDIASFISDETGPQVIDGVEWEVTTPINGEGATLQGGELGIQQSLDNVLEGLGYQFNYTYVDSKAEFSDSLGSAADKMEGLSRNSYNFVLYYQNKDFSARMAYNYRDEYLRKASGLQSNPEYGSGYEQLDLNLSYTIVPGLQASLKFVNLTDEINEAYSNTPSQMRFSTSSGRRAILGLRYNF